MFCPVVQEKRGSSRVQTSLPHGDEGPQLPRHPAAVYQLPRRLQRARRLSEAAAGRGVRRPSGLRGGGPSARGPRQAQGEVGGPGPGHRRGRSAQAETRGAAGRHHGVLQREPAAGPEPGDAAAGGRPGDQVRADSGCTWSQPEAPRLQSPKKPLQKHKPSVSICYHCPKTCPCVY